MTADPAAPAVIVPGPPTEAPAETPASAEAPVTSSDRPATAPASAGAPSAPSRRPGDPLPIRMLHDRVLVSAEGEEGERRSASGILIPATASVGKRLAWATVVALGQNVRQVGPGDRVLFDPEERAEVELEGAQFILLRERDIHAVSAPRVDDGQPGLYL